MTRTSSLYAVRRRVLAAAAVTAAGVATALASAPAADAAFSVTQCGGDSIVGAGATFQNNAHANVFTPAFQGVLCFGAGSVPGISYTGGGSGAGRTAMGATGTRSTTVRFAGTDEPLTATLKTAINQGSTGTSGDDAQIHQIPIAAGAIAPLVNFPNNCDVNSLNAAGQTTSPAAADNTNRIKFTRAQFEKIMNGDQSGGDKASQWKDIFPTIAAVDTDTGTPGPQNPGNQTDAGCQDKQITRIVRQDSSGSTFALKDALDKFPGGRDWAQFNANNRLWPNAAPDAGAFCGGGLVSTVGVDGPDAGTTPSLQTACSDGGGPLVDKLIATDGSIGYVDLSTAVSKGLQINPTATFASRDNDTYFTQLENGTPGTFQEPTLNANGFKTGTPTNGANCTQTTYNNVPTSTLGDWSAVSGTDAAQGYGICTLTYALAFDDNATAYGISGQEERQARTVKDYLTSAVANSTQLDLDDEHYAALPNAIRTIAQTGVNAINWNKAGTAGGGGGGGGGSVVTGPGGSGGGGSGGGSTPPPVKPSNAFSVPRTSLSSKTGAVTLSIRTPGPGTLVLEPTATVKTSAKKAKTKKVKLGKVTRTVSKAGLVKITVKPTGSALSALKKAGKLKVSLKVSFTPKGGTRRSSTRTITLKYTKPKKKAKR